MSLRLTRIMYIERKEETLNGPARIGRVTFSKTRRSVTYQGREFQKSGSGNKWNHFDTESGDHYWISGPRRDGKDRLYPQSSQPVEIDNDVLEEYWTEIRQMPICKAKTIAN